MRSPKGLTQTEVIVILAITTLLVFLGIFIPMSARARPIAGSNPNSSHLRGIHQAAVSFAVSNGSYLPGLNSSGVLLDSTDAIFSSLPEENTGVPGLGGAAFNTRLYILLKGGYIEGKTLQNPLDQLNPGPWANPSALPIVASASNPTGQFSYTLLNIADSSTSGTIPSAHSPGRTGEWRDNANSQAILICDRNSADNTSSPRSVWAYHNSWSFRPTTITDWKGNVVWGDGHAEFITSSTGFNTRYLTSFNTNDSLFQSDPSPGKTPDSAFFNFISGNY